MQASAISEQDIIEAYTRISSHILMSPVLESKALSAMCGLRLLLKAETMQECGSFKIRGALNAVLSLCPMDSKVDETTSVCAHSSGNHASAVALAAKLRGINSHIIVPCNTPKVKTDLVKSYGGSLYVCDPTMDARE
jgi:threonine dehydratase